MRVMLHAIAIAIGMAVGYLVSQLFFAGFNLVIGGGPVGIFG